MFGKKKVKRLYLGHDATVIEGIMVTLCELEDDIGLTDAEQDAMDVAIQAISDILNAMRGDGKIKLPEAR